MVLGNGFFSDTIEQSIEEMQRLSGSAVKMCVFPTIGNIKYYIALTGDLFGLQIIHGKILARRKKHLIRKKGYIARLQESPAKELYIPVQNLIYCTFVLHKWVPELRLDFKNRNPYDCRIENLKVKCWEENKEWTQALYNRQYIYSEEYIRVCHYIVYHTGLSIEDSEDIASQTFWELCTTGNNKSIKEEQYFVRVWYKLCRMRAIDFCRRRRCCVRIDWDILLRTSGTLDVSQEPLILELIGGAKQSTYLRMWMEGWKPKEIALICNCSSSTVRSSISRSISLFKKFYKQEKWKLNRQT